MWVVRGAAAMLPVAARYELFKPLFFFRSQSEKEQQKEKSTALPKAESPTA
jgi:hypothetical protein